MHNGASGILRANELSDCSSDAACLALLQLVGKRSTNLSITHMFNAQQEPEFDIGEP